jgi:plastocyanin
MQRRTFLAGTAAALTPAIAGCGGGGGNGDDNGNGEPSTTDDGGMTTTDDTGMTTTDDTGMTTTDDTETTTDDTETTTAEPPSEVTVDLANSSFDPIEARVAVGGTVEWVNQDGYNHDVTSAQYSDGAENWDYSESLGGGESVSRTFDSAGVYEYYCTIHGQAIMCGVVVVGDTSYDGNLPCEDEEGGVDY